MNVDFRLCQKGEITQTSETTIVCSKCGKNYFSLSSEDTYCKKCDLTKSICPGGYQVIIKDEYWRPFNYSNTIFLCKNAKKNCATGLNESEYKTDI